MHVRSIEYIEDLSASDVELLAQLLILSHPLPIQPWLEDQSRCMANLPPQLKKPRSLIPRLVMALDAFGPKQAYLCSTHRRLNPYLIRRIWVRVSAEATVRLEHLRVNHDLPQNIANFVKRLSSINSLWLSPEFYRTVFSAQPSDPRFLEIPKGCEACILAAVGGNPQILTDLRASILGRRRHRGRRARLLVLVEAWMDWRGDGDELREESEKLGRDIRQYKRKIRQSRQQRRDAERGILGKHPRSSEESSNTSSDRTKATVSQNVQDEVGESNEKDDKEEHDFEGSIIDFYASLMSTASLVPTSHPTEGMPPAFSNSVVFDAVTGTFQRAVPTPQPRNTTYSESAYSDSGICADTSMQSIDPHNRTAAQHAQAYRALMGIQEEEESVRGSVGDGRSQRRRIRRSG